MAQSVKAPKPVLLLAFANDRKASGHGYLPRLTEELRRVRDALEPGTFAALSAFHADSRTTSSAQPQESV